MAELIAEFELIGAFWTNVQLMLWSALFALVLGTVVAILRLSPVGIMHRVGAAYVTLLRNTPLTLIIVFTSVALWQQLGFEPASRDAGDFFEVLNFRLAVLGLSVYHAAFVCEALRSGVNTIPVGQAEAYRSIGLTFSQGLRHVIMPQAFRGAITPLGNVLIALTKNTTVASAIGVAGAAYQMDYMIEFRPDLLFAVFGVIAVGFVIIVLPIGLGTSWLAGRLAVKR